MKKIKAMIESASSKKEAMEMLNWWRLYSNLSDANYQKGREMIRKEFSQN